MSYWPPFSQSERRTNFYNLHKLLEENGVSLNSSNNFYYKLTSPALIAFRQEDGRFQIKSEKEWYIYELSDPFTVEDAFEDEDYHLEGGVNAIFDHIRTTFFPEPVKAVDSVYLLDFDVLGSILVITPGGITV
jgi:hypothetical protein